MDETTALNQDDDAYADRTVVMCDVCHLPKLVTSYEMGFLILRQQLVELKEELKVLSDKIDIVDRRDTKTGQIV